MVKKSVHRLCGVTKGLVAEFAPVIFSQPYNSYACLTLHSALLNYKLRAPESPNELSEDPASANQFLQLAQYFFSDKKGVMPEVVLASSANGVYDKYVGVLNEVLREIRARQKKPLQDKGNFTSVPRLNQ